MERAAAHNHEQVRQVLREDTGRLPRRWHGGDPPHDDLETIQGNAELLAGKVQEYYGRTREQAEQELDRWIEAAAGRRAQDHLTGTAPLPKGRDGELRRAAEMRAQRSSVATAPVWADWFVQLEELLGQRGADFDRFQRPDHRSTSRPVRGPVPAKAASVAGCSFAPRGF